MAGVKGRSGRRSRGDDALRLRVLQKAWVILENALDDPDVPAKEKREIASKICVKDMPTEVTGGLDVNVTEMPMIQKATGEALVNLSFNIGSNDPPTVTEAS